MHLTPRPETTICELHIELLDAGVQTATRCTVANAQPPRQLKLLNKLELSCTNIEVGVDGALYQPKITQNTLF